MALEFSEYVYPKRVAGTLPQLPHGAEVANQSLAIGAGSVQSAVFNARTQCIVLTKIDADARIAIGANPVAVSAGAGQTRYVKTGQEYSFDVMPGQKLAVIQA